MKRKVLTSSFAFKFTLVITIIFVFITATLSLLFLLNINSISYSLGRTNIEKNIENLKDNIEASMLKYVNLLDEAGYTTSTFFNPEAENFDNFEYFFKETISGFPEIELLYFSSNEVWNSPSGYWISSPKWTPPEDWDQTIRPWFHNAKITRDSAVFTNPFRDANTGEIIVSVSKTIFNRQGRDIGVIAMDMLVTKLNAEITKTKYYSNQELYLLSMDGFFITNPDTGKIMTNNFFNDKNLELYKDEILSSESFHKQIKDFDLYSSQVPLTRWHLVSLTPNSEIFENTNRLITRILITGIIIFIACILVSLFSTYVMLTKPLVEIQQFSSSMAMMNFTNKFKKIKKYEIGDTQRALIKIQDNLKQTLSTLGKNANMVTTSLIELSSTSMEISATANEQSASVAEIVTTMENNKELSVQISEKTGEVADLASRTQELSLRGSSLRDLNEDMMLDILNQNTKIIEIINNLTDILSRIDESIQLIDSIADRTKLIAFNAALEASSAGEESGSRFSVVAGEIRRFADNVVDSVVEVKEKINELQDASKMLVTEANNATNVINIGYKGMIEQKEIFEKIVDASQNVAARSQQISGLSKQQESASIQVFTALKEISAGISQFVSSTEITQSNIDKLNSMSIELEEIILSYQITDGGAK